jgi:uncharacterized membrane protein
MNKRRYNNVYALAVSAIMIAIMFIFGFTPLGTIQTPILTITLMGIPVSIIAVVFGPWMGALAGLIWGGISMIQAFTGMDATALILQSSMNAGEISSARYFGGLIVMCVVARVLVGFLTGVIYDAIRIKDKKGIVATIISCACTALLNTILFMTSFCLFYYGTPVISHIGAGSYANPFVFVFAIIGINFVVEFLVNSIVGSGIVYGIKLSAEKMHVASPFPRFFVKKEENKPVETTTR